MQLMIDISTETPESLVLASTFLKDHAALRQLMQAPGVPEGTVLPPPPPPALPVSNDEDGLKQIGPEMFPSEPLPPVAPPQNSFAGQVDSAGVPYDSRIHQPKGSKKKDGTWKIRKGLDPSVIEFVMRELSSRVRTPTEVLPAGSPPPPPFPVKFPPGETVVPPAPQANVPPPPAPETQTVDPFRALITKITKARSAGLLTPDEIAQCVAGAGAPSLQLLNNMPHLIPHVDAAVEALLSVR